MSPVRRRRHAKTAAFRHPPGGSRGVVPGPAVAAPTTSRPASRCRASARQSETARKPRPSLAGARFGLGVLRGRLVLFVAVVRSGPVWVVLFSWSVLCSFGLVLVRLVPGSGSGSSCCSFRFCSTRVAPVRLCLVCSAWSSPFRLVCCHRLHVVCSWLGSSRRLGLLSPPRLGLFLAWSSPFRLACCRRPAWSSPRSPVTHQRPGPSRTAPHRIAPWPHSTSTIQTHPATPPEHSATRASNPSITTTRHHQTHHTTRACNSPQKTPHNSSTPNNAGLSWTTPTTQPDTVHTTQPHALKSLTCSVTFDPRSLPAHTYTEAPFPDQPAAAARPHTNRTFHHHSTGLTVPKSPGHRPSQLSHTRTARGPGTI